MINNRQFISFYTIFRRELVRMFRIATQVFLPPVITSVLYFVIFGKLIGNRIGPINGLSYMEFIVPGLIMMSVITNSYMNVSTSLYSTRFQKNIEEILISPTHDWVLLLGYGLGGVFRGLIIAVLIYVISTFFVGIELHHLPFTLFVIVLVATLFSMAGFTNAMLARNFDEVALVPTFILTPLTYLGGVFYSKSMLPEFWQKISAFNPIIYMVNAIRYAMTGQGEVNFGLSLVVILGTTAAIIALNLVMLNKGIGLRE